MKKNKIAKLLLAIGIGVVTAASSVAAVGCNNSTGGGNNDGGDGDGQQQVQPKNEYTVTFDTNGGFGAFEAQTVEEGETLADPGEPTPPEDYEFAGWFTAKTGGTEWIFGEDGTKVDGTVTVLYAQYTEIPEVKYDITFDANGGELAAGTTATVETNRYKVSAPENNPTKSGVTFLGWSREQDGKELINFNIEKFTESATVYAVWYTTPAEPEMDTAVTTLDIAAAAAEINGEPTTGTIAAYDGYTYQGKFTFSKGNFEAGRNPVTYNNQQGDVKITVAGETNKITIEMQGASGAPSKGYGALKNAQGAIIGQTEIELENGVAGSIVVDNLPAGTYTFTSVDESINTNKISVRITKLEVEELVEKGAPVSISALPEVTETLLGRGVSASGLTANVKYVNNSIKKIALTDAQIDDSAVNSEKPGVYPVRVKYTESGYTVVDEYQITVYNVTSLEFGTYKMGNGTMTTLKTVYPVGGTFSADGLTVLGKTASGLTFRLLSSEYSLNNPNLSVAGATKLTVSADAKVTGNVTVEGDIDVYVVAKGTPVNNTVSVTVDPSKEVTSANFKTISQALDYVSGFEANVIKEINIADGVYREKIYVNVPNVHFIGSATETPNHTTDNGVVIVYDAIAGMTDASGAPYGTNGSGTVMVNANGFVAENITFKNYYNTYELYQASLLISGDSQAVALYIVSDDARFFGCKITSYHDTLYANKGKHYFEKCWIEGHTDYIFGQDAISYFYDCDIFSIGAGTSVTNGGYVTALKPSNSSYYYVYNNCRFDADENTKDGSVALGRTWGVDMKMVVINSVISGKFSTDAYTGASNGQRYCNMNGAPKPANMLEYNNSGDGAITSSLANTCTYMDEATASSYGIDNLAAILGFNPKA